MPDEAFVKAASYLDSIDVVEVQRGPEPGGVGGAYRAFGETLRGLKTTMSRLIEGPLTIEYPEEKTPVYPRFRGRHKLHRFEDTGLEKCVGCSLCAAACPADCIRVVAAENIPGERVSAGERYAAVYEINLIRCIFCGYCEIACPFDAITMGHDYEMADYNRTEPDLHQGDAAGRADRAHPAEKRGRSDGGRPLMEAVLFFLAAIGATAGAIGVVAAAQPLLRGAGADRPPVLAGGALPAPDLGLRRRGPGGRLRGRGDGALRLRRRLCGERPRAEAGPGPRAAIVRRPAGLLPLRRDLRRRPLLRPQGPRHPRPRRPRRLRRPRRDRHPPPRKVPRPLRGLKYPASHRRGRSNRPRRAETRRPTGRWRGDVLRTLSAEGASGGRHPAPVAHSNPVGAPK